MNKNKYLDTTTMTNSIPDCAREALGGSIPLSRFLLFFLLLLIMMGSGCSLGRHSTPDIPPYDGSGGSVIKIAKTQIGTHYKAGGNSPQQGFDCSGFVCWTYAQCGITLPRRSKDQMAAGRHVPKEELKPGDLVGFSISSRGATHTGIYTGNNKFIHSPASGDSVREDSLDAKYWKARLTATRRIVKQ